MALPVLLLFFVVGVSVCVAFSLKRSKPTARPLQISARSPWKPSLTDYGVCLRRRPVLPSALMLSTIRRLQRLVAAYKLVDVRVDKRNVKTSGAGR